MFPFFCSFCKFQRDRRKYILKKAPLVNSSSYQPSRTWQIGNSILFLSFFLCEHTFLLLFFFKFAHIHHISCFAAFVMSMQDDSQLTLADLPTDIIRRIVQMGDRESEWFPSMGLVSFDTLIYWKFHINWFFPYPLSICRVSERQYL